MRNLLRTTERFVLLFIFSLQAVGFPLLAEEKPEPWAFVVEEPNFQKIMDQLAVSTESWNKLSQTEKLAAIHLVTELFKQRENSAILQSNEFYLRRIDESLASDSSMALLPFPLVLKVIAVMEYDFYNGENKEQLARTVLGDELFERNKRRRLALGHP